jgi:DNA-binding transcriptional ArsR family regulator
VTKKRCDLLCIDFDRAEALRGRLLPLAPAERAAEHARALGDPTRLLLASALGDTDELCVGDLAWIAERPQSLVSHHLRILRAAGLVSSRRDGKMVMYTLTDKGWALLAAVLAPEAAARR